jgi:DeoR/GlpR family transcriptional regulator of sugar metabolism
MALEGLGELRRVHGGVVARGPGPEAPIDERGKARLKEKRAIARAAMRLVAPGQTLFLDAGSTVSALAEELAALSGLTVVTNSFDVALKLVAADDGAPRHEVILLGGRPVHGIAATYGAAAVAEIHRHRADCALLSPVGVHAEHGATSYEHHEAEIARAMVRRAQRHVILADHSKIGQVSRVCSCAIGDVDVVVSDARAQRLPAWEALGQVGCELVVG